MTCPEPVSVNNAVVTGTNYTYEGQLTYTCNVGYAVTTGDLVRECQTDGTWSGDPPVCMGENQNMSILFSMQSTFPI